MPNTGITTGDINSYTNITSTSSGAGIGLIMSANVTSDTTVVLTVTSAGTDYLSGDTVTVTAGQLGTGSSATTITLTEANFNANSTYGSTQIELDVSEQTSFILKTLFYFGVVVKDPQIIQVAASQIQQEENNSKR